MNKIVKIALVASAMLVMLFTTGCYEVINKIRDIVNGESHSPTDCEKAGCYAKYCLVTYKNDGNFVYERCYELDKAFTKEQCNQLEEPPGYYIYNSPSKPSGLECTKYSKRKN